MYRTMNGIVAIVLIALAIVYGMNDSDEKVAGIVEIPE